MNELIFFLHVVLIGIFCLLSLRIGKSALVSLLCMQAIIANLFVLKQITLFQLNATSADVYIVGSVITLNLIQEYYGKAEAIKAIWTSFLMLLLYTIVSQFQIWYTPSNLDIMHSYFSQLLSLMPRITIASMITYLIVQHTDSYIYGFFKKLFAGNYLLIRNYITIMISQFLDTVLFSFLGLYGIINNLSEVMIVSYIIKIIVMLLAGPFIIMSQWLIKKENRS